MTPRAFLRLVETDLTPSFFITGNHPTREVDPAERNGEPMWVVHFPSGFEAFSVAVFGHGLNEDDVIDAALEFMLEHHPETKYGDISSADNRITVTPPSRSAKSWEPTPVQTAANDDEMRANGSFQEGRRRPVAERDGDIHRMSFARSETKAICSCGWHKKYANAGPNWRDKAQSEHMPNRIGHMTESLLESSHELSYEETLYRGDEQAEIKVVITATYHGAEAGMPQSYASGGSPPDAARVDFDSIRAFKADGSHEKVELDDDERAAAEARLSTMAEGGFVDDIGADDRD